MRKQNKKLTSFNEHLEREYGKKGTDSRNDFEQGFEAFKLGTLIHDLREKQNLTQTQLAYKCSTTKSYISRIENDASDIRLSTLMRIVKDGLGGELKLSVFYPVTK
jgi:DNA-binding XRE family transcriptional regulator